MRNINDPNDMGKTFKANAGANKDYFLDYVTGSQRNVLYNLANAIIAIENDEELMDAFHFNLATNREMLKTNKGMVAVDDKIIHECREFLQKHCGLRAIKKDDVDAAIHVVSRYSPYDPLMDQLNSYVWDGIPRIDTWLIDAMGCEDNTYIREVGAKSIMAMVKRAKEPGCQCDYMLILEGPQGIKKSKAVKILGGDFYSENLPALDANGGKEAKIHVVGYWIIEVAELHAMYSGKIASAQLKQFISCTHERFRPVHARREVVIPRRCFFVGTTNEEVYLRDPTGERRSWPVKCTKVDVAWLEANRNQMLAEALQRVRDGEDVFPSPDIEDKHFKAEQAKRQEFDELTNLMIDQIGDKSETTGAAIWRSIHGDHASPSSYDGKRMANIFQQLGFHREKDSKGRIKWIKTVK